MNLDDFCNSLTLAIFQIQTITYGNEHFIHPQVSANEECIFISTANKACKLTISIGLDDGVFDYCVEKLGKHYFAYTFDEFKKAYEEWTTN